VAEFDLTGDIDVPELPVVDLITLRRGSSDDQVTEDDIYYAQYNWRLVKLYRLAPDRRKDLCTLLVSLAKKLAPDLRGSDMVRLWAEVVKDPSMVDRVFSPKNENR